MAIYIPGPKPFIDWKRMNTDVDYRKTIAERMVAYYTKEAEYCDMMAKRSEREIRFYAFGLVGLGILIGITFMIAG